VASERLTKYIINTLISINNFTAIPLSLYFRTTNFSLHFAHQPSVLFTTFIKFAFVRFLHLVCKTLNGLLHTFPAMHLLASVSLVSLFSALSSALPTLSQRSDDFCPGMFHYKPGNQCPSGFLGCVSWANGDDTCGGPKRFNNDCSGGPGLGSFYNCANGFRGCSTNPRICDIESSGPTPPVIPPVNPPTTSGTCPQNTWYARPSACSSGFVGCTSESKHCEGEKRFWSTCPPDHGTYVVCNGFVGCTTDHKICG
jgi:hypothetical protein